MATFLEKCRSFSLPNVLLVLCIFVILIISHFSFEGGTLVLIASISCHGVPLTLLASFIAVKHKWIFHQTGNPGPFCVRFKRDLRNLLSDVTS